MIGKLKCWLFGHKRGKRVPNPTRVFIWYRCPRCNATWSRKVKLSVVPIQKAG